MLRTILLFIVLNTFLYSIDIQKPKTYMDQNISGWMMSEKLDGIRGVWDGKNLYTKTGHLIYVPKWFTKHFPPFSLDGELYTKIGDFENIQSIVLSHKPSKKWKTLTYNVFEVPNAKGDFLDRLKKVKLYESKYLKVIKQRNCKNKDELEKFLNEIELKGGEGVIIKNPNLKYFSGRSSQILKVKRFSDMEGEVIGYNQGRGKYHNMIGSLRIRLKNKIEFNLGTGLKDKDRKDPPPLGSMVTFRYKGFTKAGKPKLSVFLRKRDSE